MYIPIISELAPTNSGSFALIDAKYTRGANQAVADATELSGIPLDSRKAGMSVYVVSSGANYRLVGGITNSSWSPVVMVSSGLGASTGINGASLTYVHNMGYFPNVTILDGSNNTLVGQIVYNNINSLTINFNRAASGIVYLS